MDFVDPIVFYLPPFSIPDKLFPISVSSYPDDLFIHPSINNSSSTPLLQSSIQFPAPKPFDLNNQSIHNIPSSTPPLHNNPFFRSETCSSSGDGLYNGSEGLNNRSDGLNNVSQQKSSNEKGHPRLSFADTVRARTPAGAHCLPKPSMKGNFPSIRIGKSLHQRGLDFCKFALVGRMDLNQVKPDRIRQAAPGLWKLNGSCKITPLGRGFFMIRLDNEVDFSKVLTTSVWYIDGTPLKIQRWTPDFEPAAICQSTANVWIRFPGLRQQFWDSDILMSMANAVGVPISIDPNTRDRNFGFYASILVKVDMAKPLAGKIIVDIEESGEFYQNVEYYKLPKYCSVCRMVGHSPEECRRNKTKIAETKDRSLSPEDESPPVQSDHLDTHTHKGINNGIGTTSGAEAGSGAATCGPDEGGIAAGIADVTPAMVAKPNAVVGLDGSGNSNGVQAAAVGRAEEADCSDKVVGLGVGGDGTFVAKPNEVVGLDGSCNNVWRAVEADCSDKAVGLGVGGDGTAVAVDTAAGSGDSVSAGVNSCEGQDDEGGAAPFSADSDGAGGDTRGSQDNEGGVGTTSVGKVVECGVTHISAADVRSMACPSHDINLLLDFGVCSSLSCPTPNRNGRQLTGTNSALSPSVSDSFGSIASAAQSDPDFDTVSLKASGSRPTTAAVFVSAVSSCMNSDGNGIPPTGVAGRVTEPGHGDVGHTKCSIRPQGPSTLVPTSSVSDGEPPLDTITGTTLTTDFEKDSIDIRHASQPVKPQNDVQSSVVACNDAGGGRGWKVSSKLFRDKRKKASSFRLDNELRETSIFNRWEDLADMEESDVSDFSDDYLVDPIVETPKKPKGSSVTTRQQARQQHL